MFAERKALIAQLEKARDSKVLLFVTGDRSGLQAQIGQDSYDLFVHHLDLMGVVPKISLVLYTRGGDTLAAWSIVNLIRQFCTELEVIIPSKAHSAGTLMSLAGDRIVMTKQATLGPIDPSVNHPLAPQVPGRAPDSKIPVSVEAIYGFIDLATNGLAISEQKGLTSVLEVLAEHVHPLVLGTVNRSKNQIKMLARRLVSKQVTDPEAVDSIIKFLCSDSGSHDYTIHRREARELGLSIDKPDDALYSSIKSLYDDFASELELSKRFDPRLLLPPSSGSGSAVSNAPYSLKMGLIESVAGGSHYYVTEGTMERITLILPQTNKQQIQVNDHKTWEGWKHEQP